MALGAGAAQAATKLEIRDAVTRVVVVPEARGDLKVEVQKRHPGLPMRMWVEGDTVKIDGDLGRNAVRNCHSMGGRTNVNVRGRGEIGYDDMPILLVRAPMNVQIKTGGAVFGEIRNAASVELGNAGCGDWKVGDVGGRMSLHQAGSGDTQAGRAGSLEIRIAGSGDVETGPVSGDVDINIAGSGDAHVASVGGRLTGKVAGSGDISVDGGRASEMTAQIAGSGDVKFGGVAGTLKVSIAGSGDVSAERVEGAVDRKVIGSGGVYIGH
jgi:hypothetical protein